MKRQKDVGLDFVIKMGLNSNRNMQALRNTIRNFYGEKKSNEIFAELDQCSEQDSNYSEYYNIMASHEHLANLWQGGIDADIIRNSCNWIDKNKEYFGDTILEVGCGLGYISCFLGILFPDKHIVAIDSDENGIKIAKKNAEKMNIENVEFRCEHLSEENEVYDSVISFRVAHEQIKDNLFDPHYHFSTNLFKDSERFENDLKKYFSELIKCIKPHGNIISAERFYRGPRFLMWLKILGESGFSIHHESYKELYCEGISSEVCLQAGVYIKTNKNDDYLCEYEKCVLQLVDTKNNVFEEDDAYNYFWLTCKNISKMYKCTYKASEYPSLVCVGRFCDENVMFFYNQNAAHCKLTCFNYNPDDYKQLENKIYEDLFENKSNGYIEFNEISSLNDIVMEKI